MTKCDAVLKILSDGKPHRTIEFINPECGSAGLERIRELRKKGYIIEAKKIEGSSQWSYTLMETHLRLWKRYDPAGEELGS